MPAAVSAILVVLAVVSIPGGLALGGRLPDAGHVPLGLFALVLAPVLLGVAVGYALHRLGVQRRLVDGRAGRAVGAGPGVGALQRLVVVRPVTSLARLVAFLDREVIDTYVRAAAWGVLGLSDAGTAAHRRSRPASGLALLGGGLLAVAVVTALVLVGSS
ncbi:hypothetical protein LP422_03930 [Janibacter limosus]|uniref:Uncharacterized protein n=1 Tax=Janibacter limosus TaxID=53458 RepID=A0AC61U5Q2_9MICO|nr:hypothetical protein [Janibacter limosus]UUZ45356.1 hypothetical protein LP422_03930 [Janibacter limosus]